jgi:CcmD family protein
MLMRILTLSLLLSLAAPAVMLAQQPPAPQSEFVPADSLPPAEQLPAAPLFVAAYAFVWVAAFFYVWTIWKRLNKVESEMQTLERRSRTR